MYFLFDILFDIKTIFVVLIVTYYYYVKNVYSFWTKLGVAQMPPKFPFGNSKDVILRKKHLAFVHEFTYNYFKNLRLPYGGYYVGFRPDLMLVDPEIIKQIFVKDFQYFNDRGAFVDEKNDPLTAHLFALAGEKWKNLRTKLSPTFTSGKMKMMFSTMVPAARELTKIINQSWGYNQPLEIKDLFGRFTTDIIGSCVFGIECNSLKNPESEFRKYGTIVFQPKFSDVLRFRFAMRYPNLMRRLKIRILKKEISDFFIKVVEETVHYRENYNIYRNDFLQLLLQLRNNGKLHDDDNFFNEKPSQEKSLTIEEIAAQCFVFFLAGFESTSTTLSFCLFELSQNLYIQDKLREEVNQVLKKHGGKLSYDAIMEMQYLDKIVLETLRKYPPLASLVRKCTRKYTIPDTNITLQYGQVVRVSVLGIHKNPEYYPDPEKFDPERFSEEKKYRRPPCTYLPFGEGPRICIATKFGLLQTKVGIAAAVKHHRFKLSDKTKLPLDMQATSITLATTHGIWVDVENIALKDCKIL